MVKVRKIPQRMCVACREKKDKRELLRVVRTPEGGVVLDSSGKAAGRGAYLCGKEECWKRAEKSRALERALGLKFADGLLERLQQEGQHAGKG